MFGHAALLSEWPTALGVRAHEDTLCYRIPETVLRPVLARPAALRFAARSLTGRYEMRRREIDPLSTQRPRPGPPAGGRAAARPGGDHHSGDDRAGRGRTDGGGRIDIDPGRPWRPTGHRHRPRPACPRGGGRRLTGDAGLAGDDHARSHDLGRRDRRRRTVRDARSRGSPPAGARRLTPGPGRDLRHRPVGGRGAHALPPAAGDRRGRQRGRGGRVRATPQGNDAGAA